MVKDRRGILTDRLETAPAFLFNLYAATAAFCTYFCMYAFRKPFAAASFKDALTGNELELWDTGIALKTALVISQIVGYALSKFLGIKFCSEITRARRALALVVLIVLAQIALVLFAVVPQNWKVLAIFLNGLPLGMVWGMVVWYLEGRRASELLLAGLSCSFIVSSGIVKQVGLWLMNDIGVSDTSMPMVTGLLFLPPFLISVWLLDQVPDPDAKDVAERTLREPMDARHRITFTRHFFGGLAALILFYFFLTAYRDFRDNYAVDILDELGLLDTRQIFARTEIPVAIGVLIPLALLSTIRNNRWALAMMFALMTCGTMMMGISTFLFRHVGSIDGLTWMILIGFGAYIAYVPFGSMLFDRIIASTHIVGTAVFAIYVADAVGYVGSTAVQVYKDLYARDETRFEFFCGLTYFVSVLGTICLVSGCIYFLRGHGRHHPPKHRTE